VIGSGFGGLAVAIRLQAAGYDTVLYEAADKPGGRAYVFEDEGYTFYVNVDNIYLQTEMKESREDVALMQAKFIWGNVLIGLALIHDSKRHHKEAEQGGESVFSRIDNTTRALGPFLIPMIDHLGALSEQDVATAAARGDDD
jgi:phytoene dehydrogenase-like protein